MPATRGSNCSKGSSPSCFPMTRPCGSMNISVGQARPPKRCQTAKSRSFTTGCSMRYRSTASRKLAVSRSAGNLGEWTPTTITRSPYFCSIFRNCGKVCMQLIQQKVQKSMIASRPRRSAMCSGRDTLSQSSPCGKSGGANRAGVGVNGHPGSMVPTPCSWASYQRYNVPNTMSASGWWRPRPGRLTWPARRPSLRAVLIAILAVGLALSMRGASAILLNGQPTGRATAALASTRAAADAAILADSNRLTGAVQADPHAVRASAQVALAAGRNDATIATFLKLRWAGRLSAALERYGAMLTFPEAQQLSLAAAGIQHYAAQLHNGLLHDGPGRMIIVS